MVIKGFLRLFLVIEQEKRLFRYLIVQNRLFSDKIPDFSANLECLLGYGDNQTKDSDRRKADLTTLRRRVKGVKKSVFYQFFAICNVLDDYFEAMIFKYPLGIFQFEDLNEDSNCSHSDFVGFPFSSQQNSLLWKYR